MKKRTKIVIVGAIAAIALLSGASLAFAGSDSVPGTDAEETQFIGDPPGNDQTGEWEGDFNFEG